LAFFFGLNVARLINLLLESKGVLVGEQGEVALAECFELFVDFRPKSVLVEPMGRGLSFKILKLLLRLILVIGHLPPKL